MENTKLRASQKYKKRSTFDSIWRQLRKNKGAIVGMILLVVIIIIALASPYIFNYETDVIANNVKERMQHPSSEHWFGTDDLGRDIFARVCYGARYSLAVGLVAVAVALVVGVTLGAAAGYVGGVFENLIMRVCDIFSSIPSVLMAIAVVSALGKSTFNLMLAVGIASTAPFIRVARAAVLTVRGEEYVESARAIGSPEWKIVAFHILPNCVSQIIVQATLRVGSAIISAAQAELPRSRRRGACAGMGQHALGRPRVHPRLQLHDALPGHCHHADGAFAEPDRRRSSGRARFPKLKR